VALLQLGRLDEARAIIEPQAAASPTTHHALMRLALLRAEEGRLDEAERAFVDAQYQMTDDSPIDLAKLWEQQGRLWRLAGRIERARELFEAAHDRLPPLVEVSWQLALVEEEAGPRERALTRLRQLADASDDPRFAGELAALRRDDGAKDEAERLHADAARRFEELCARHPEAYADEAARFHLRWGDAKAALPLAERSLAVRKTLSAHRLLIEVALAAGAADEACRAAAEVRPRIGQWKPLHALAAKAFAACGRPDDAAAERRAAE
jgi:tetratricopeptide (TPR) repeat protein